MCSRLNGEEVDRFTKENSSNAGWSVKLAAKILKDKY